MAFSPSNQPPDDLVRGARDSGFVDCRTWRNLSGGRTNMIWKCRSGDDEIVFKVFCRNRSNELFPNDIEAEISALSALEGSNAAPLLKGRFETSIGPCLVYSYLKGEAQAQAVPALTAALYRLHNLQSPSSLRHLPMEPQGILELGQTFLNACSGQRARFLRENVPTVPDLPAATPVFLHGDPTPANAIMAGNEIVFVDWQCPAIGDPTHDLAIALSPAMHLLYGTGALSAEQEDVALEAYGNSAVIERYRALAPAYHWRMACYCQWKAERGDEDYEAAGLSEFN